MGRDFDYHQEAEAVIAFPAANNSAATSLAASECWLPQNSNYPYSRPLNVETAQTLDIQPVSYPALGQAYSISQVGIDVGFTPNGGMSDVQVNLGTGAWTPGYYGSGSYPYRQYYQPVGYGNGYGYGNAYGYSSGYNSSAGWQENVAYLPPNSGWGGNNYPAWQTYAPQNSWGRSTYPNWQAYTPNYNWGQGVSASWTGNQQPYSNWTQNTYPMAPDYSAQTNGWDYSSYSNSSGTGYTPATAYWNSDTPTYPTAQPNSYYSSNAYPISAYRPRSVQPATEQYVSQQSPPQQMSYNQPYPAASPYQPAPPAVLANPYLSQQNQVIDVIPTLYTNTTANKADRTAYTANQQNVVNLFEHTKKSTVLVAGTKTFVDSNGQNLELPVDGTGFFVTSDGEMATDYHVVRNLKNIKITTADGKQYDAVVDSFNSQDDVALLSLQRHTSSETFQALALGNSNNLSPGEELTGVGHPKGWQETFRSPGTVDTALSFENLVPQIRKASNGGWETVQTWNGRIQVKEVGKPDETLEQNLDRKLIESKQNTQDGCSGSAQVAPDGTVVAMVDYYTPDSPGNPNQTRYTESTPAEDIASLLQRTRSIRSGAGYASTPLDLSNDSQVMIAQGNGNTTI